MRFVFEIFQDDDVVCTVDGEDRAFAENEILRYASQYEQDGPIVIVETVVLSKAEYERFVAHSSAHPKDDPSKAGAR